jgi:HK97 gp10 family phage protein
MEFDIDVHGLEEIAERLHASVEQMRDGMIAGVKKVGEVVRDAAQENLLTAGAIDTGELFDSIQRGDVEILGDTAQVKVTAHAPHGTYVEFGTGPKGEANHAGIDPSVSPTYRSTGWAFPLKDGTGFRYTEGMPARPFMYPAKKQTEDKAQGIIAEEIRKAVSG